MTEANLSELYDRLNTSIQQIDEVLDAQEDQTAAGKRKIINGLIEQYESLWSPAATELIAQISTHDIDTQIGVFYGMVRALNGKFVDDLAKAVTAKVEAQPKVEVTKLSDEEEKAMIEARSDLYSKIKSLIEMAKNFGLDAGMELPKRRNAKKGPRGKRALSYFVWNIDDKKYEKLGEIVEEYAQFETVGALTKAMREAKIDTKNPGDRIEFSLPDGKILVGVNTKDSAEEIVSPVDDDSEDEDDGEAIAE